jgi:ABC-type lipoprotein release transport system permease subunit
LFGILAAIGVSGHVTRANIGIGLLILAVGALIAAFLAYGTTVKIHTEKKPPQPEPEAPVEPQHISFETHPVELKDDWYAR